MKQEIQNLYASSKKIRYLLVGIVNTIFGLVTYPLLYLVLKPIGAGYITVLLAAQVICISFSFASNKYFVFKTNGNLKNEYIKFFSFHAIYFSINLMVLPLMVEVLKLNPIIAQTLFSVFVIVTSYFWHNMITFKVSKDFLK